MSDGVLSQEEIDALLKSSEVAEDTSKVSASNSDVLTINETEALHTVMVSVLDSVTSTLNALLAKNVKSSSPVIELTSVESFNNDHRGRYVVGNIEYTTGLSGHSAILFQEADACLMVDLMMDGDGSSSPQELNEMHLGILNEALNQVMGTVAGALTASVKTRPEYMPPNANVIDISTEGLAGPLATGSTLVQVKAMLDIEGFGDKELIQLIPIEMAKAIVSSMVSEAIPEATMKPEPVYQNTASNPVMESMNQSATAAQPMASVDSQPFSFGGENKPSGIRNEVPVQPVQFAPIQPVGNTQGMSNIDLIMDVPLQISVELGRSKKTIREILALGQGSVIELDKLAGEPVDLLVNGKLLAKGEVVIIDENFGIRVTDIVSKLERVTSLQ